jgi:hypothetical protein
MEYTIDKWLCLKYIKRLISLQKLVCHWSSDIFHMGHNVKKNTKSWIDVEEIYIKWTKTIGLHEIFFIFMYVPGHLSTILSKERCFFMLLHISLVMIQRKESY